jgi:hypothetical protein
MAIQTISGLRNARRLIRSDLFAAVRANFDADRESRFTGKPPAMIKVVAEEPGEPCALPTDDSATFFFETKKLRAPAWKNEVTLKSVEMMTP